MLVLSRKKNESIVINGNIRIEILQIKGKQIRLGITAPPSMKVLRGELPARRPGLESRPGLETESQLPEAMTQETSKVIQSESSAIECDLHAMVGAVMANA